MGRHEVIIVGGGIGGLVLALSLHEQGIPSRVFEASSELRAVGAGINLLPHAVAQLAKLGIAAQLEKRAVTTMESVFYNRFGQLIYAEPAGRAAGYPFPQLSIHRADLQDILATAVRERLGSDRLHLGHRLVGLRQDASLVIADFEPAQSGDTLSIAGPVLAACDGIHSAARQQFYPEDPGPRYSGVNMWRGVTTWPSFLSGASMVRAGWLKTGKMVIYPIRNEVDASGRQLVNWVAEIETPRHRMWDWNRTGVLDDFIWAFEDWKFDWLDVPAMIRSTPEIFEFPMVDKDPLPRWSFERATLLGDAAHPMYPRGSNGAVQAILDARCLAQCLSEFGCEPEALSRYEDLRRPPTTEIVLANRVRPPDLILQKVFERTGDRPFTSIDSVISREELAAISASYKSLSGFPKTSRS